MNDNNIINETKELESSKLEMKSKVLENNVTLDNLNKDDRNYLKYNLYNKRKKSNILKNFLNKNGKY